MKVNLKTLTFNKIFKKAPIVSLDGQPVLLFNQQHPSLLIALEQKKVQVFSECRNGYCGACKTKIISGSVIYHTEPLVKLKADECLPCCCTPVSDLDLNLSPEGADVVTRSGISAAVIIREQTKT
ncbi:2Fe-2S ferredoxin-like protein [Shewanella psychropiezotolerans]|uniref:2Fe-2S ferredoxin-like protein n=1 Tax=Shewanella psychropiezotolerans TaxID=2593655 RepID=A0ABX5X087_9GAMM|nr:MULTISPECIES: class I ribonucleotide reductase maintenance protein YfaE [Shewanella]MPY23781.1 2Fe-2S ferredoxin-like protein [Shewanella sp. YLB-07]QDO84092.1 2Fe-2S ferredoxin-like protein [Shewanella psychropiezotolerans]